MRFGVFVITLLVIETAPRLGVAADPTRRGIAPGPLAVAWMTVTPSRDEIALNPLAFRGLRHLARVLLLESYREAVERACPNTLSARTSSPPR